MTIDGKLDERYLHWLYSQVGNVRLKNPARTHWQLINDLMDIPFEWSVPNDDNRIEDGKELRFEFLESVGGGRDWGWIEQECSFLEMLIALSRRIGFNTSEKAIFWFWRMLENVNLKIYTDEYYDDEVRLLVKDTVNAIVDRRYRRDGVGGLFPLGHAKQDQREVELWYQMSAYILENGYD